MYKLRELQDDDIELVIKWIEQDYIAKWFGDSADWLDELKGRKDKYSFIHHFIVEDNNIPIGFVQYYDYNKIPLEDDNSMQPDGTYGIDYLIGSKELLGKGIGKELVNIISKKAIEDNFNLVRLVADPTIEETKINTPSIKILEFNGFHYDLKSKLYIKDI